MTKEDYSVKESINNSIELDFFTCQGSTPASRMKIQDDGSLILVGSTAQKASGTSWSNPSDTRLKDNKQNYTKGLNELLQIQVEKLNISFAPINNDTLRLLTYMKLKKLDISKTIIFILIKVYINIIKLDIILLSNFIIFGIIINTYECICVVQL